MGQIARALGLGSKFEHRGHTYTVAPWTYEVQGEMELYLEAEAVKALRRLRTAGVLSEEEFQTQLKETRRDIVNGEYTFGSESVARALTSLKHLKHLLFLQLRPNHPEMTPALASEIVDDAFEKAMEAVNQANADPTTPPGSQAPPPAAEPAGPPPSTTSAPS